jgi:UPF0755 protein
LFIFFKIKNDTLPLEPYNKKQILFHVPKGIGISSLLKKLENEKLIKSSKSLKIYSYITGKKLNNIKYGYYLLSPSMSGIEILNKLIKGDLYRLWLTIPEGFNINKISKLISNKGLSGKKYKNLALNPSYDIKNKFDFLKNLPNGLSLEGYLFPDTYDITGLNEEQIIYLQLKRFNETIYSYWKKNKNKSKLSFLDTLNLASIVELEAQNPNERELIAGVFIKRLGLGMKLGSDPTVEYALGKHQSSKGLSFKDILIKSPYNTYINSGLPPGPISNPGLESFKSVINYKDTNYLYFVAKGDGSHVFTKTYQEHLQAQRVIISKRNKN